MSRVLILCAFFILSAVSLSACSAGDSGSHQLTPPPAEKSVESQNVPPAPTPMDTFRALAPPEGLKFTPLFADPAKDTDARFNRLEAAVQSLRNDLDTVVPSMVRMVAVEKDMKQLVGQLQTLTDAGSPAPVAPVTSQQQIPGEDAAGGTETDKVTQALPGTTAPSSLVTPEAASKGELPPEGAASPISKAPPPEVQKPPAAQPVSKPKPETAPVNTPSGGGVKGVRVGDHADKTRVVLDLTAKAGFTASLENNGKTLVIEIPGMDMSSIKPFEAMSAALVSGWHVEGQKLKLDLLYVSTIKAQSILPPNGSPYHRLIVDLFSKDVHD